MYTGSGISNSPSAPSSPPSQNGDDTGTTNPPTTWFGREISSLSLRSQDLENGLLTSDGRINTQPGTSDNENLSSQHTLPPISTDTFLEYSDIQEISRLGAREISHLLPERQSDSISEFDNGNFDAEAAEIADSISLCNYIIYIKSGKTEDQIKNFKSNPFNSYITFFHKNPDDDQHSFQSIRLNKYQCKYVLDPIVISGFYLYNKLTLKEMAGGDPACKNPIRPEPKIENEENEEIRKVYINFPARHNAKNKEGDYRFDLLLSLHALFGIERKLPTNNNLRLSFKTDQRPTTCKFGYYTYENNSNSDVEKSLMDRQVELTYTDNFLKIEPDNSETKISIDTDILMQSIDRSELFNHKCRFYLLLNQRFATYFNPESSGWCEPDKNSSKMLMCNPYNPYQDNDTPVDMASENSTPYLPIEKEDSTLNFSDLYSNDKDGWLVIQVPPSINHKTNERAPRVMWLGSHNSRKGIELAESVIKDLNHRSVNPIAGDITSDIMGQILANSPMTPVLEKANLQRVDSVANGYCFYDTLSQHLNEFGVTQGEMNFEKLISYLEGIHDRQKYTETILQKAESLHGKTADMNKENLLLILHDFALERRQLLTWLISAYKGVGEDCTVSKANLNITNEIIRQFDTKDPADVANQGSGWATDRIIQHIAVPMLKTRLGQQCSIMLLTTQHAPAEAWEGTDKKIALQTFNSEENSEEVVVSIISNQEEIINTINGRPSKTLLLSHTNNNHFERLIKRQAEPHTDLTSKQNSTATSTSTVATNNIDLYDSSSNDSTKILLQNPETHDVVSLSTGMLPDSFLQRILAPQSADKGNSEWEFTISSTTKVEIKLTENNHIFLKTTGIPQNNQTTSSQIANSIMALKMHICRDGTNPLCYWLWLTDVDYNTLEQLKVTTIEDGNSFDGMSLAKPDTFDGSSLVGYSRFRFRNLNLNQDSPQPTADLTLRQPVVNAYGLPPESGVSDGLAPMDIMDIMDIMDTDPDMQNVLLADYFNVKPSDTKEEATKKELQPDT